METPVIFETHAHYDDEAFAQDREIIKKNGEFTVNIALVEKGVPVLGVISLRKAR